MPSIAIDCHRHRPPSRCLSLLFFPFKGFNPGGVSVLEEPFRCRDVSVDGGFLAEIDRFEVALFNAASVFIEHPQVELGIGQMLTFGFLEPFGSLFEILFDTFAACVQHPQIVLRRVKAAFRRLPVEVRGFRVIFLEMFSAIVEGA